MIFSRKPICQGGRRMKLEVQIGNNYGRAMELAGGENVKSWQNVVA